MKSILDPTFIYTPSVKTDVRKTFARIRRELHEGAEKADNDAEFRSNVLPLSRRPALPASAR
jgi:hypothetical protein